MHRFDAIWEFYDKVRDVWDDRDLHWMAMKSTIVAAPEKFRQADPIQRRNLLIVVAVLIGLQILMFL